MDRRLERLTGPTLDPSGPPPFPPPPVNPIPPTEPEQLKLSWRTRAGADPEGTRALLADPGGEEGTEALPGWLWQAWGTELQAAGASRQDLDAAASALTREIWLWMVGDREWDELAGLLYGRAVRLGRLRGT